MPTALRAGVYVVRSNIPKSTPEFTPITPAILGPAHCAEEIQTSDSDLRPNSLSDVPEGLLPGAQPHVNDGLSI